jgi:hypothetical protein
MSLGSDAQKHKPGHCLTRAKHKFTKILILGQEQPAAIMRIPYRFNIGRARRHLSYIGYVMSRVPKPADKPGSGAFIGESAHAGAGQR